MPVPKIIRTVEPKKEIHGAILMECLPGNLLKTEDLSEVLTYEIGKCLAQIHQNRLQGYGDPLQKALYPDPRTYFTLKFEEGLDECKHNLPLELLNQCQKYYKENVDLLMLVDGPCIAHRDFRPGNLLIHEGKLRGVIDWAGARASFVEEDLCSIEHGNWLCDSHKNSFLDGYANTRPVPNYKMLISFLRLNTAIATIGFTVKRGTWDKSNSHIYQYNRQFLENFLR